ncbi:SUMF1/EgtB/PvdO family nonheme iron enzyme [Candidatus Methylospira mobilis]|uniref:SUMF1/EgtB/PvdO family nonheme iron enzyme n=1 Tax=Candidatus Methylospira mobilis TaxID=1808979 RepID=A0A5Q0BKM5_9GAMM|nr:caspase family protein [Candidatus Methylospira mobilis]QFY44129.1 SUMF1/EgtB/PvdO family nonheme iron enzyme [Candidatus Methylospira mobilis]WNV06460.1 caspase family protein [Candidatus Methylospira mobilis]
MKLDLLKFLLLFLGASSLQFSSAAAAGMGEERIALVIGNDDYQNAPLMNPLNDAHDMKAALEQVGFSVIYKENLDLPSMEKTVQEFTHKLNKNSVGLFYYSGHGAQVDGSNFLVPVKSSISNKSELKARSYDVEIILDDMEEAGNGTNIVILDACRDNPFKGVKDIGDGLTLMSAPRGSLIAFATAPDSVASDKPLGQNSLYTKYLKKYIVKPNLDIQDMFVKVREGVEAEDPDQVPWEYSSLTGSFCFAGCSGGSYNQVNLIAPEPNSLRVEVSFWESIRNSHDPGDFRAYLKKYPDGQFALLARNRLIPPESPAPARTSIAKAFVSSMDCAYCPETVKLPEMGISFGKYEVTQNQWRAVMGKNPSYFFRCGGFCPVEYVSWDEVQLYIQRLNQMTGKRYRLPTEDEWFAACQAGGDQEYCGSDDIEAVAWYNDNSGGISHPAGQKKPNAWGLYDMSGNVGEWTSSCKNEKCLLRRACGGSWSDIKSRVDSGYHSNFGVAVHYHDLGFRLVLD